MCDCREQSPSPFDFWQIIIQIFVRFESLEGESLEAHLDKRLLVRQTTTARRTLNTNQSCTTAPLSTLYYVLELRAVFDTRKLIDEVVAELEFIAIGKGA